jgi:hypothetical protein
MKIEIDELVETKMDEEKFNKEWKYISICME